MTAIDPELLAGFLVEANGYLSPLQAALGANDAEQLVEAHRLAHTIAGAANMGGLPSISAPASRLEQMLEPNTPLTPDQLDEAARLVDELTHQLQTLRPVTSQTISLPEDEIDAAPELAEIFLAEAADHLRLIGENLPKLRADTGNRAALATVRRSAHTLKGSGAMVGYRRLARLAHAAETLLDRLADRLTPATSAEIDLLFQAADCFEDMAQGRENRTRSEAIYRELSSSVSEMHEPTPEPIIPTQTAEPEPVAAMPQPTGEVLRVPAQRIDDAVKLVGELLIARSAFEQRMTAMATQIAELDGNGSPTETNFGTSHRRRGRRIRGPLRPCEHGRYPPRF